MNNYVLWEMWGIYFRYWKVLSKVWNTGFFECKNTTAEY